MVELERADREQRKDAHLVNSLCDVKGRVLEVVVDGLVCNVHGTCPSFAHIGAGTLATLANVARHLLWLSFERVRIARLKDVDSLVGKAVCLLDEGCEPHLERFSVADGGV